MYYCTCGELSPQKLHCVVDVDLPIIYNSLQKRALLHVLCLSFAVAYVHYPPLSSLSLALLL